MNTEKRREQWRKGTRKYREKHYDEIKKKSIQHRKENQKQFCIAFNVDKDKKIIDKLQSVPNKIDYIRNLILDDLVK